MSEEIEDLKANQKMFSRALVEGDKHFGKLEDNIAEIKNNMIKVNYALFGNGVNGVTQNIELILKRIDDFSHSCKGKEHSKSVEELNKLTKEQGKLLQEHEDIVKAAKGTLKIFKYLGLGGLVMVGMAIMHSLYNLALYLSSLIGG